MIKSERPQTLSLHINGRTHPGSICTICSTQHTLPDLMSRCAVTVLFAGLLFAPISQSQAEDDLLDPGKIGAARKSMASEGLLDPSSLKSRSDTGSGTTGAPRDAVSQSSGYARSMAASVVTTMDTLTQAAADLVEAIIKLDRRALEINDKLSVLRQEMQTKLGEYRSGMFCSGCNHTKSEIEAKGERFPHPGQKIIRPTPEQIAAKERELQVPIDRLAREMEENRAKRKKAFDEREEALLQIGYGLRLWRAAISFEYVLIRQDEDKSAADYKTKYDKAESQIGKLRMEKHGNKPGRAADIDREIRMWSELQERLDQERRANLLASQNAIARANAQVNSEQAELQGYLGRGRLPQVLNAVVEARRIGALVVGSINDLGWQYRMGSYDPVDHDKHLPSVERFLMAYRRSPQYDFGPGSPPSRAEKPQEGPAPMQQLKGKLRELLKCDPAAGDICDPPKKMVPTGVRG